MEWEKKMFLRFSSSMGSHSQASSLLSPERRRRAPGGVRQGSRSTPRAPALPGAGRAGGPRGWGLLPSQTSRGVGGPSVSPEWVGTATAPPPCPGRGAAGGPGGRRCRRSPRAHRSCPSAGAAAPARRSAPRAARPRHGRPGEAATLIPGSPDSPTPRTRLRSIPAPRQPGTPGP